MRPARINSAVPQSGAGYGLTYCYNLMPNLPFHRALQSGHAMTDHPISFYSGYDEPDEFSAQR